jgi:hypothetical protein
MHIPIVKQFWFKKGVHQIVFFANNFACETTMFSFFHFVVLCMLGLIGSGVDIGFLKVILKHMEKEGVQQTWTIVLAYWNNMKLINCFIVCFY